MDISQALNQPQPQMRRSMLLGNNYEKLFFGGNKSQNPYNNHEKATIVMPMNNFEGS